METSRKSSQSSQKHIESASDRDESMDLEEEPSTKEMKEFIEGLKKSPNRDEEKRLQMGFLIMMQFLADRGMYHLLQGMELEI
jgi:hypothetical protein